MAIADIFGSAITGPLSFLGGILSNRSSARQAEKQMQFQEEMSNTSYQRAVADMKAAGINPMLAAKVGGASTPPGAASTFENVVPPAVHSAQQGVAMRQAAAQIDLLQAQTAKIRSETMTEEMTRQRYLYGTEAVASGIGLTRTRAREAHQRTDLLWEQTLSEPVRRALLASQAGHEGVKLDVANTAFMEDVMARKARGVLANLSIPEAKAVAAYFSGIGQYEPYGRGLQVLKDLLNPLSSAGGAARFGGRR